MSNGTLVVVRRSERKARAVIEHRLLQLVARVCYAAGYYAVRLGERFGAPFAGHKEIIQALSLIRVNVDDVRYWSHLQIAANLAVSAVSDQEGLLVGRPGVTVEVLRDAAVEFEDTLRGIILEGYRIYRTAGLPMHRRLSPLFGGDERWGEDDVLLLVSEALAGLESWLEARPAQWFFFGDWGVNFSRKKTTQIQG
ncbi:MAG: hypothetical protein RL173_36 [Fibrobacterota bacterium]|jgi:hypothetical protein